MFKFKKISILLLVVVLMLGLFSSFTIASAASLPPSMPGVSYQDYVLTYRVYNSQDIYNVYYADSFSQIIYDDTGDRFHFYVDEGSDFVYYQYYQGSWSKIEDHQDRSGYISSSYFYDYSELLHSTDNIYKGLKDQPTTELFYSVSGGYCDGSACPATDSNHDGICDVCGLVLRLASIPEAPSTLPDGVEGSDYALYIENGRYYLLDHFNPINSTVDKYSSFYRVNYSTEDTFDKYHYLDGAWSLLSQNLTGSHYFDVVSGSDIIHYPTTLTFDGNDFFVPPLTLEEAVKGGIADLLQTMVKALTILVGLGVFLMASLIGLDLFGKVLNRYLH